MKCTQRLYLSKDRKKVVPEGSKEAATLYAVPGDEIPQSAAELFGLVDGHLKGFDPEKERKAGQDKEHKGGSDKGNKGGSDKEPSLTDVKGIGPAAAKAFAAAGITTIAQLAAVDLANPPKLEGLPTVFKLDAVVDAAKELAVKSGEPA